MELNALLNTRPQPGVIKGNKLMKRVAIAFYCALVTHRRSRVIY